MKLLILTQKIDKNDPILGFFHKWIEELSKKFENITVICLEKGGYSLPQNVNVLSLGKEKLAISNQYLVTRIRYVWNFYKYIWNERKNYDAVFVHMNEEYVLLGGIFWKIFGKKTYLWRNHPHGSFLTRIAVWLSYKVFCTSKYAYVVKYKKVEIMPVGIDIERFKIQDSRFRVKDSILFLGRMSPIKKPDLLVEALGILKKKGVDFIANFYGEPLPKDRMYFEDLKKRSRELDLDSFVRFHGAIPNEETPEVYARHEIFVNLTPTGSMDKTIFEAMACGCIPLVSNYSLTSLVDDNLILKNNFSKELAAKIKGILFMNGEQKEEIIRVCTTSVKIHSLDNLVQKIHTSFVA
jgi:glycosyltransferase involved in cell wall biosynthesis